MTLKEYILTYEGVNDLDERGIVCNIPDYYNRYIKPLGKRFEGYSFYSSKLVVCFIHDDHDPSLGLIKSRFLKGVYFYHCFGCGHTGSVITMHQYIRDVYDGLKLTEDEACMELANLFDIPIEDFSILDDEDFGSRYIRTLKTIDRLKLAYTKRDYGRALLGVRKIPDLSIEQRMELAAKESIKLIATEKCLYI